MINLNAKNNMGFTLIELLVVMSIISLMSSIVMTSVLDARHKANYGQTLVATNEIKKGMHLYYDKYNAYPLGTGPVNSWSGTGSIPAEFTEFLSQFPTPPCYHWQYTMVNSNGANAILLRRVDPGFTIARAISYVCVDSSDNCSAFATNLALTELKNLSNKLFTCSEGVSN